MKSFLRSLFLHLRSLVHGLAGRVWSRLGKPDRATRHFERVLTMRGDDPFDPIEPRIADTLLVEAGARATWRAERPPPSAGRVLIRTRARDDFTSEVERQRFHSLGPISAAEIDALDVDLLLRRLAESG